MRGALDTKARRITPTTCATAARAIARLVPDGDLGPTSILTSPLDDALYPVVAEAVAQAAVAEGLARVVPTPVAAHTAHRRRLVALRQAELAALSAL